MLHQEQMDLVKRSTLHCALSDGVNLFNYFLKLAFMQNTHSVLVICLHGRIDSLGFCS